MLEDVFKDCVVLSKVLCCCAEMNQNMKLNLFCHLLLETSITFTVITTISSLIMYIATVMIKNAIKNISWHEL